MIKDIDGKLVIQKSETTRLVITEKNVETFEVYDEELDEKTERWHAVGFITVPRSNVCEMAAGFAIHYSAQLNETIAAAPFNVWRPAQVAKTVAVEPPPSAEP